MKAAGGLATVLFFLFISFLLVPAYAEQNWQELAKNVAGEDWYIDPASVKSISPDIMAVSVKRCLTKEAEEKAKEALGEYYEGGVYTIVDMMINCSNNKYKMLNSNSYGKKGSSFAFDYSKSAWAANGPAEEIVRKRICRASSL